MTTASIQKRIYEILKAIDDVDFLTTIEQLVHDKAGRGALHISHSEWEKVNERSIRAKRNLKNLKSWKAVKKNILSSKNERRRF